MPLGTVAVVSDVHGNAVALEAVLAELGSHEPELVVFGGDLTWGPLPEETLALVDGLRTPAVFVRGNAERALLEPDDELSERGRWLLARHSPEALAFLASFVEQETIEIDGLGAVRFCHGSPRSDEELVTPETPPARMGALSEGMDEKVLVTAHTHLQFDRTVGSLRSVNPGSIGMAYGVAPGTACWALLATDVVLRQTSFSVEQAAARYSESGDPAAEQMIEILVSPPARDEVIEHAERLEFSG
ncbi:MAG TPA: metallophosphoesterase family protein [Gaiella sp.]|nr:metallophosphoesterase family protein [Gaiella sp.]